MGVMSPCEAPPCGRGSLSGVLQLENSMCPHSSRLAVCVLLAIASSPKFYVPRLPAVILSGCIPLPGVFRSCTLAPENPLPQPHTYPICVLVSCRFASAATVSVIGPVKRALKHRACNP